VWSAATHIAESMAAVPMIIVPVRLAVIVPVLKSIIVIITTSEPVVLIGVFSVAVVVASHNRAMHRKAAHPTAMAAPCAAAMGATTAARQRTRVA
jgi:hypothetical protein